MGRDVPELDLGPAGDAAAGGPVMDGSQSLERSAAVVQPPRGPREQTIAMPPGLTRDAKAVWQRIAPQLYDAGLLCDIDRELLETYCNAVLVQRKAARVLRAKGLTFETTSTAGDLVPKKRPEVEAFNQAAAKVRELGKALGIGADSRAPALVPRGGGRDPDPAGFTPGLTKH